MSDVTRRDLLRRVALALAAAAPLDALAAQETHRHVQDAVQAGGGRYVPAALSAHEFRTLERLTDLIVPPEPGRPGAVQADVAAWIDTLLAVNAELKTRYVQGLAWIDRAMATRGAIDFVSAPEAQQTALLDLIAYRRNRSEALDAGIDFFVLLRRMTVDGFYTSDLGMRDIYPGNRPQAAFTVPPAAIEHVLSRSPLK